MPNILRKANHVGVVGGSGTGKTEFAKRYLVGSRHDRVFIFDHQQEFASRLGGIAVNTTAMDSIADAGESYRVILYDPSEEFRGNYELALALWCDHVWELSRVIGEAGGETLVLIDELQKLISPGNTPTEVKALVQTGRKWGLDTCFVSQQPNRMPNEVREQWTTLVAFRLKTENSRDSLDAIGFDAGFIEEIGRLPDLHYFYCNLLDGNTSRNALQFSD